MPQEHVEGYHELSAKTKIFLSSAVAMWDAEFYVKVDDDVHVNLGMLASTLARHRSKPRVYIGCPYCGLLVLRLSSLMTATCAVGHHQTASGRHWLATCALHLLTGAAVKSANPWRRSNLFMKNAEKEMNLHGVLSFKIRWNCICWQSKIMKLFNCGSPLKSAGARPLEWIFL